MPIQSFLRLNMTGFCDDPKVESDRYRAAIDMAVYAEEHGFSTVSVEEHHCADNGWLPSPLTLASMIAARTNRININVTALLVTLYDPVRLAEDIAVIDLVSQGRFSFVAGMGYRPTEYHALGRRWEDRGKLMDEAIETMLAAWTGKSFDYHGQRVRVTPMPYTKPHPFFLIGGMSKVAARRAARFGIPFFPPMAMPELEDYYREQLEHFGTEGFTANPGSNNSMIFVEDDPEAAWSEWVPYFLRETQEYGSWKQDGTPRPSEQDINNEDDLRAQERYEVISPEDCLARVEAGDGNASFVLHPLIGGVPLQKAWKTLERYVEKVVEGK